MTTKDLMQNRIFYSIIKLPPRKTKLIGHYQELSLQLVENVNLSHRRQKNVSYEETIAGLLFVDRLEKTFESPIV